jgi:hypothetical protein
VAPESVPIRQRVFPKVHSVGGRFIVPVDDYVIPREFLKKELPIASSVVQ